MPENIKIRKIKKQEAIKLRRLFKKALFEDFSYFPGDYLDESNRQNNLLKMLKALISKSRVTIGIFDGRKLLGYLIADISEPRENFIFWVYIKNELRGFGYGKKLINSAIKTMRDNGSKNVYLMTHQLEDFYKSIGFDTIYKNNTLFDDIIMYEMGMEIKNEAKA